MKTLSNIANSIAETNDDIFASQELATPLAKFQIPQYEENADSIYQAIKDELMLDGNSRQNLATFCQTYLDDNIHKIMDLCIDKNMIDKDEYPQSAQIENRCVAMLANLWNSPEAKDTLGCSTTGSSEAAMLGGLALLRKWQAKRKAEGKDASKPNLVCGPVQICWHKFCRYWGIEMREVPMKEGVFLMTSENMIAFLDENTIGVVPTFGITYTGEYENVKEIAKALDVFEENTKLDIPIHVDAASGGFLAPFSQPEMHWDFRIDRVKSINASGHKFGLSPLGVGWVVWRTKADLPENLIFWVNYLGGNEATFALNFSRPAGQIIAQYYNFLRLGYQGYKKIQDACYATTKYLADEVRKLEIFDIISDGSNGIPALSWKLKKNLKINFNLYDLADRLRSRGWLSPAYSLPKDVEDIVVMRVLVKHGFSMDIATLYIDDLKRCLEHFNEHPVSVSLSKGSFNHGAASQK